MVDSSVQVDTRSSGFILLEWSVPVGQESFVLASSMAWLVISSPSGVGQSARGHN